MAQRSQGFSPRLKLRLSLALILVVLVLGGLLAYPQVYNQGVDAINAKLGVKIPHYFNLPFRLGLDLQGGTQLVYQADVSQVPGKDQSEAVEGVRDVIERRINAFGVAEPLVQTTKEGGNYRVLVEMAGVTDVTQAIKMIGETPFLEFKEEDTTPKTLTEEQKAQMDEYNKQAKSKANDILAQVKETPDNFATIAKEKSEDTGSKEQGGEIGYLSEGGANSDIFDIVKNLDPWQISSKILETDDGYNIIRRGESKDETRIKANHLLICWESISGCPLKISKEDAQKKITELKNQATKDNFVELVKANSTEPNASTTGGELGFFAQGQMVEPFEKAAFALQTGQISDLVETQFGYHLIYKTDEKQEPTIQTFRILIAKQKESDILPQDDWKYTGLSGKQLKNAQVNFNPNTNEPEVSLVFNDEGSKLFEEVTARNVGKVVGIFLDNEAISMPTVNEKITGGQAVITGKFTLEESKTLVRRLNAGALPVPISIVSQQNIGASLGQQFVDKSLMAGLLAFILIAIFMIAYYRLPGLLSIIALVIYTIINIVIFKSIPVTLTLSGIAGFVLSAGMAVDANVLIFERMKEELGWGKPLGTASEEGFKRAWTSIRDGNLTTLLSCIFLYWFGSSMIRGFALTLFIGVVTSMLSALIITRTFMNTVIGWKFVVNNAGWLFPKKNFKK